MRAFWDAAPDEQVATLFEGLVEAWDIYAESPINASAKALFDNIIRRLRGEVDPKQSRKAETKTDAAASDTLLQKLVDLSSKSPQARGYEFERFLRELFEINELAPRASFRLVGEQLDGSFELRNETYLLEAKWQNSPVGAAELHTFEGKLSQKASWSRGLFVSISGFSQDGLVAFGRGKRVVCMDGFDLSEILRLRISFEDAVAAKVRRAAESGRPYVPIRELIPDSG